MRAFIAIGLPQEIKESLTQLQQELKATQADVKWVRPDNIHLTLKFLGEIDDTALEKITDIINGVAGKISAFKLRINSLGAFPKIDSPRVIWVGVDAGDKEVKEIATQLEGKIEKLGIPKEDRPFSSHITIGRTKSGLNRQNLVGVLKDKFDLGGKNLEFFASKITLFKSTLSPKGPTYEILKEVNLKTI